MGILKNVRIDIVFLFLIAFAFRFSVSFLPAFEYDQSAYRFWSQRLTEEGFSNFYSTEVFTNNPTGYLYVFWFLGFIKQILLPGLSFSSPNFDLLLKLPANVGDLISGFIIYKIITRFLNKKWGVLAFALYVFNPATFFNSAIWGQYDGFSTMIILAAFYTLLQIKKPEFSAILLVIAFATKPQAIFLLPISVLLFLNYFPRKRWLTAAVSAILTALVIYLPFFPNNPVAGLIYVNFGSSKLFDCTTCFAFNLWGIFGNWGEDSKLFFNLPLVAWGVILTIISQFLIFLGPVTFFKRKFNSILNEPTIYLTASVSVLACYMFLTRMHERYLFPTFSLLLLAALLMRSKFLMALYVFVSLVHTLNLYLPYSYYNNHLSLTTPLANFLSQHFRVLSLLLLTSFLSLLIYFFKIVSKSNAKEY